MTLKELKSRRVAARRALKANPEDRSAWLALAAASFELGDARDAVEALDRAEPLGPLNAHLRWLRTRALYATEDLVGAAQTARGAAPEVAAIPSPGRELHRLTALCARCAGPLHEAPDFHALVGETFCYGPYAARATAAFDRALALDPAHARAALRRWELSPVAERDLRALAAIVRRSKDIEVLAGVASHARPRDTGAFEAACLAAQGCDPWDPWGEVHLAQVVTWLWRIPRREASLALARHGLARSPNLNLMAGYAGQSLTTEEHATIAQALGASP